MYGIAELSADADKRDVKYRAQPTVKRSVGSSARESGALLSTRNKTKTRKKKKRKKNTKNKSNDV